LLVVEIKMCIMIDGFEFIYDWTVIRLKCLHVVLKVKEISFWK